ncbi:7947_t:CDS:10 [Entrophospora sp. SA101]|nr:7947_t:CDS:10 [Entrophospora sp. SA101]
MLQQLQQQQPPSQILRPPPGLVQKQQPLHIIRPLLPPAIIIDQSNANINNSELDLGDDESLSLLDNPLGHINDYGTKTAPAVDDVSLSIEEDLWFPNATSPISSEVTRNYNSKKFSSHIFMFGLLNIIRGITFCNPVSGGATRKYNIKKFFSHIFMFGLLNIIYGITFGVTLFPHHLTINNNDDDGFERYKFIGISMYFIRAEIIRYHIIPVQNKTIPLGKIEEVIYTTIFAYGLSATLTGIGLLLFVIFKSKIGFFLEFFPRHIYIGATGGVGFYLIMSAIMVSSRIYGPFDGVTLNLADDLAFSLPKNPITIFEFYTQFNFGLINWEIIIRTIPIMLVLAFFTILSVQINISKLELSFDDNQLNTDHSNTSIKPGEKENNRVIIGLMLAFLSGVMVVIGPYFIKYIPRILVATVIAMVIIGLIEGIFFGIVISYIFFMVLNHQKGAIKASFSGNSARSSVRRHYRDQKFLKKLGSQIYAMMLQGYLFYGSMKGVEDVIKKVLIDREQKTKPIRFFILNMLCVTGFDINSVQVLERIQKYLQHQNIYLVICGISYESQVHKPLKKLSFWKDLTNNEHVKFFDESNEALEWCENSLLGTYYAKHKSSLNNNQLVGVQHEPMPSLLSASTSGSFRSRQFEDAGKGAFENELRFKSKNRLVNILMKAFNEITNEKEEFYNSLSQYFTKEVVQQDSTLWGPGSDPNCIYVVEEGQLTITWTSADNKPNIIESILPLTMVGELGFFTDNPRQTNLVTKFPCVLWKMDRNAYFTMTRFDGYPTDRRHLGELLQSVAKNCRNLKYLSILYNNNLDNELFQIFNNCNNLKIVSLKSIKDLILDADKIFSILIKTLPKHLVTIKFTKKILISDNSLSLLNDLLEKHWQSSKPLYIKFGGYNDEPLEKKKLFDILIKYQNLASVYHFSTVVDSVLLVCR